jgi:ankyrin repeat protein
MIWRAAASQAASPRCRGGERGSDKAPSVNSSPDTALMRTIPLRSGLDLVTALLAHGANPDLRITKGTPVRRNGQDFELPATLIGATPYFLAAKFLEVDIMQALSAGGADTHLRIPSGEAPLIAAAGLGASPQTDWRGLTVLDGGVEDESRVVAAVAAAIADGGDVNAVNRSGNTVVHAAALLGYEQVIQQLVDARRSAGCEERAGADGPAAADRKNRRKRALDRSNRGRRESTVALLRRLAASE